MRQSLLNSLACLLVAGSLWTTSALATEVAGVKVPDAVEANGASLSLNGAGLRTRAMFKLYVGALYLEASSGDADEIMQSDKPMAIWLRIRSRLVSQEKMKSALLEGFTNATNGDTAPIQAEIDQLMSMMSEPIKKRDRYTLAWDPNTGTRVSKNDTELGVIQGLAFKQALFGIWLSEKPAQASLKKSMLGG